MNQEKKKNAVLCRELAVVLALFCMLSGCTEGTGSPETAGPETQPVTEAREEEALPDSLLYYGTVEQIRLDDRGNPAALEMDSPGSGPMIMDLGEPTVYVDSGERKTFDPGILQPGDRIYVFHSPVSALTLPPQSPAFVVVRNIPMDASCPMYHRVEKLETREDRLLLTTDRGTRVLALEPDTEVFTCGGEPLDRQALRVGDRVMAWYWFRGEPETRASHVMVLPE